MKNLPFLAVAGALALAASGAPASAARAGNFTIVNMSGADWQALSIRRFGTQDWRPLGATPAHGARGPIAFDDPDCAFDIRADIAGIGPVVWQGVNLCGAKAVILHRNARGAAWVDYE
ncbi:MAG TPA: hypothetical protein VM346_03245 [Sphingomicrobium sp.]|nr:hypothetical protein [Sphingomicrobium sp.]